MFAAPWIAALIGGLVSAAASFFGRALIAFGVGVVSYGGIHKLLENIKLDIIQNIKDVPVQILQIMGLLKIDVCISILLSAITVNLVIKGLTGGVLRKWVTK
ncbi:DUF2523 domain-containing protein [Janthinobacterium sp. B9-8]|uniref:DUF2523 domain-containing protein n=1 Tax=Janthinobacterium sp. B9-8 TaxID=1236179 RepID=UPI00061D1B2E|nr:DUF2523 domain-containing protein [Janthinobacterium sp. B9-8]AMC34251.1 hypothetical protein VN23_06390 [Janthinobacterium sp. B9-8]